MAGGRHRQAGGWRGRWWWWQVAEGRQEVGWDEPKKGKGMVQEEKFQVGMAGSGRAGRQACSCCRNWHIQVQAPRQKCPTHHHLKPSHLKRHHGPVSKMCPCPQKSPSNQSMSCPVLSVPSPACQRARGKGSKGYRHEGREGQRSRQAGGKATSHKGRQARQAARHKGKEEGRRQRGVRWQAGR